MENEKIKEILSDEAFVSQLLTLETVTEVQNAMKEKGVELTEEDVLAARDLLTLLDNGELTLEQLESGEIPEELLEQVAGGSLTVGGAILVGVLAVAAIASVAAAVAEVVKSIRKHRW